MMTKQQDKNAAWLAQQAQMAEQLEAVTETVAHTVAVFWKTLVADGVDEETATQLAWEYISHLVSMGRGNQ